ncbi:hypothetical protein ABZ714_19405 [Streptomyces sp. NPDC006798]|uniref:hypothetical protein n=1 Tax=Streptomyces sp. NPDC006798 TaxID=3155462 RepID=UPI0033EB06CD
MDTTPGPLAPDILDRGDLRQALAEHDFGGAFALIKKYGGLSQNRIASACQLTPGKVSLIINRQHQVTSFDVISRIADGLRIPGRLVGLAPRAWETEQPAPPPVSRAEQPAADEVPWRAATTVGMAATLTRSDLVMDRREATRALAGSAITGAALLDPLEGWLKPPGPRAERRPAGRLGLREVDELAATAKVFRAWDHQYGGGLRRKAVVGQLSEVAAHLDEHQLPQVEQQLYRVMAQLAGTAATMAWDSGLQRRAQDYYLLALRASHAGGDTAFGANILAGMARQLLYRDRPYDALDLIRLAQDGARHVAGPRVRAMLHTREAWAYASLGRIAAFERATGQARESLADADADTEPYWIAYFDDAELSGTTGGRLLDLARQDPRQHAEAAADAIGRALAQRGPEAGRSHALDRIGLARCHFLLGDLREGVAETHRAVDAAQATRSARVRSQIGKLYPLTVGSTARPVQEARDRIRDLLST